jgi:hypothetical protein
MFDKIDFTMPVAEVMERVDNIRTTHPRAWDVLNFIESAFVNDVRKVQSARIAYERAVIQTMTECCAKEMLNTMYNHEILTMEDFPENISNAMFVRGLFLRLPWAISKGIT